MFQDILLHLDTYPDPAPIDAMERIVGFCAGLGTGVSALAVHVRLDVRTNPIAERLLALSDMAKAQEAQSRAAAETLLARFGELAGAAGLRHEAVVIRSDFPVLADDVARCARTHDVLVVPQASILDGQRGIAETALFASGRPVILLPLTAELRPEGPRRVVVAWDGSRAAARAVADALPLLIAAGTVEVATVTADKPMAGPTSAANLVAHLARHGVAASVVELDLVKGSAAEAIEGHVRRHADLLVMGGYGHARMLEFVLGGVTERMLTAPPVPVFLSH